MDAIFGVLNSHQQTAGWLRVSVIHLILHTMFLDWLHAPKKRLFFSNNSSSPSWTSRQLVFVPSSAPQSSIPSTELHTSGAAKSSNRIDSSPLPRPEVRCYRILC